MEDGFGAAILELRTRSAIPIRDRAMKDPGTQFVGIHYSMGGHPELLGESVKAIKVASSARGQPLRYHAILVDPFGITDIEAHVDLQDPAVGNIFILLSAENSFLRPGIREFPNKAVASGKVHFIYAEDFGESWDHFGILTSLKESRANQTKTSDSVKALKLFQRLMTIALSEATIPLTRVCTETGLAS